MGIGSHLIHTCDIERPEVYQDSYGEDKYRWPPDIPTHLSEQRCRLIIKAQRVADSALAERPVITTYKLLLPAGTDVRQGDRITNVEDEEEVVDAGPFSVDEVLKRRARAVRHITLRLEKAG
jgi:hypothetical protein